VSEVRILPGAFLFLLQVASLLQLYLHIIRRQEYGFAQPTGGSGEGYGGCDLPTPFSQGLSQRATLRRYPQSIVLYPQYIAVYPQALPIYKVKINITARLGFG
jgi:hypothetical protein